MNFKRLFLIAGFAATTMFAAAQSRFEVKLYNSRPPYGNGDDRDTAKVRVYLPVDRESTELSLFVLVAVTVRFLWKQKVTTGESFFKIKALLPLF